MPPQKKALIAGSALVLSLALVAGVRATPAALSGADSCATPAEINEALELASRASSTVSSLKAQGAADEKIVSKYRRELANFEKVTLASTLSASATVERALASVTKASSTLAAAEARYKKFASQKSTEGRIKAALAAEDVKKAKKALAAANTGLVKARKNLTAAEEKELAERQKLAEPLAAQARLAALNVELGAAREALAAATADYEWAAAHPCEGGEAELSLRNVVDNSSRTLELPSDSSALWDLAQTEASFVLEARGGDIWVEGDPSETEWHLDGLASTTIAEGQIFPANFDAGSDVASGDDYRFLIRDGESRTFLFLATAQAPVESCAETRFVLDGIRWGTEGEDALPENLVVGEREMPLRSFTLCPRTPTGISAELISSVVYPVNMADPAVPGSADTYNFKLEYSVTAVGQDVYVDRTPNQLASVGDLAYVEGAAWVTNPIDSPVVARGQVLSASGSTAGDSQTGFLVRDGEERTFTLSVVLEATADTSAGIRLTSINWSPSPNEGVDEKTLAEGLEDFKTKYQFMGVI